MTTNSGVWSGATRCLCVVFRTERNGTAVTATRITGPSEGSGPKCHLLTALVWPPPEGSGPKWYLLTALVWPPPEGSGPKWYLLTALVWPSLEGSGPKCYLLTALVTPPPATKSFIAK